MKITMKTLAALLALLGGSVAFAQVNGSFANVTAKSVNKVLYVNPAAGSDLITQVNTLFTSCAYACEVHIPAGSYAVSSGTIRMGRGVGQVLSGDGPSAVSITYSGSNFLDWHPAAFSIVPVGSVGGFSVTCSNAAAQCFTAGDVIGARFHEINVVGPGGLTNSTAPGTSQAFVFQNRLGWTERWAMENIQIGGFAVNRHFMTPSGSGTDSYAYGLVKGGWNNIGAGTIGTEVDAGTSPYNLLGWDEQFNSGGTTTADEVFRVAGKFSGIGFHVTGENSGVPITFVHLLATGLMQWQGDYLIFDGGVEIDAGVPLHSDLPPFWIMPKAGLNGVMASVGGGGTVSNYGTAAGGPSVQVFPSDLFAPSDPYAIGALGFVQKSGDNPASPYVAYDTNVPYCLNTKPWSSNPNALTPEWCIDGTGSFSQALTAPSGSCNTGGWQMTQDGLISYCKAGTWTHSTAIDYYWTATGCNLGTGQPARCTGTTTLPGTMPDASWQLSCTADAGALAGDFVCAPHAAPLPTASGSTINYAVNQIMQNGGTGGTPTLYFHAHHN